MIGTLHIMITHRFENLYTITNEKWVKKTTNKTNKKKNKTKLKHGLLLKL
jgi:hypothetical protein